MYHFDPSGAPPAPFAPLPFALSMSEMDHLEQQQQQNVNGLLSLEQQLLLHHRAMESSLDANRCIGFDMPVPFNMQMPGQYWGGQNEQQQQQMASLPSFSNPPPPIHPHHRHQQPQTNSGSMISSGDMGQMTTIFFSPPFPYQVNH